MPNWAIDLGTTNTRLARFDEAADRPRIVVIQGASIDVTAGDPLLTPGMVPSATHLVEPEGLLGRLGMSKPFRRRTFWGRQAFIGKEALDRNLSTHHPQFVPGFKPFLQHEADRHIARLGARPVSAREVARIFLRELFASVHRQTGERVREIAVTAPVDAYEQYRAEVRRVFADVGVRAVQFIDEPVAAAAGYGLGAHSRSHVLVVDFGGGTLDIALADIDPRTAEGGRGRVLAKVGRPIGGNLVDNWLLDDLLAERGVRLPDDDPFWRRLLLDEARWVKERLFLAETELFHLRPPGEMEGVEARLRGAGAEIVYTRDRLTRLLEERGLYRVLRECLDEVVARGRNEGLGPAGPDDVLMVGGSSLLPGVFSIFEERFGRDRVRAWQPFDAVAYGACALGARGFVPQDYIVHDYALVLHDDATHQRTAEIIVPAGTQFPTAKDVWRRQLVPTCALGVPERLFKLVVCEIGRAQGSDTSFGWDRDGRLKLLGEEQVVVPLNEENPTLGRLEPPHDPGDRVPRLDVMFGVSADRWLTASVHDLRTGKTLLDGQPVVRLL